LGADLHGVQAKDTRTVDRRIRSDRRVSVVGKHHELESSSRGRRRHVRGRATTVGSAGVDVNDAGNRAVGEMIGEREARRRQTEDPENENGGRDGRRCAKHLLHW
jgi:hypothetical protein